MFAGKMVWISVVTAAAVFSATVVCGHFLIPLIKRRSHGQQVRQDGPKTHFGKSGTPTFGGLFFLIPLLLCGVAGLFFWTGGREAAVIILFMLLFGAVGFVDDYIKVHVSRKGISVKGKTILLGAVSVAAAVYVVWLSSVEPFILIPFTTKIIAVTGLWKVVYAVLFVPFMFFMSNSVNLTDGLDGLLASLMLAACAGLFLCCGFLMPAAGSASGMMPLAAAIGGGVLGFLVYNHYPARVFMGDTGSLSLGAGFALMTCLIGMPYLVLITGVVFVAEGLSVMIQVLYFRATGGRRFFKMAPIHHHFECLGWPETKVVTVFVITGAAGALAGVLFALGFVF